MLNITTLHVIQNPNSTYSYVGRVPSDLFNSVPFTAAHAMSGRYIEKNGITYGISPMVFLTKDAAIEYANAHGYEVQ